MKLTEKKQKRLIKGMINAFYSNFAWRDLESIFWKSGDLDFNEYMKEYSSYDLKRCYTELNKVLTEKTLQKKAPENEGIKFHWMILEYNQQ